MQFIRHVIVTFHWSVRGECSSSKKIILKVSALDFTMMHLHLKVMETLSVSINCVQADKRDFLEYSFFKEDVHLINHLSFLDASVSIWFSVNIHVFHPPDSNHVAEERVISGDSRWRLNVIEQTMCWFQRLDSLSWGVRSCRDATAQILQQHIRSFGHYGCSWCAERISLQTETPEEERNFQFQHYVQY